MSVKVKLEWFNQNYGASSVKIYRDTASMNPLALPTALDTIAGNAQEYEDTTVVDGNTYYYIIATVINGQEYLSAEYSHVVNEAAAIPTSGLVAFWSFDTVSGTTVTDESSNTNNGTLQSTTNCIIEPAVVGDGVRFNGSSTAWMSVPNHPSLQVTDDFSLSFWLRIDSFSLSNWSPIISKFVSDTNHEFTFRIKNGNEGHFYYGDGSSAKVLGFIPSDLCPLDTWVHIVALKEVGTRMEIYKNGTLYEEWADPATIVSSVATTAGVRMAKHGTSPQLRCTLDQVRIYNRALTSSEITSLVNET